MNDPRGKLVDDETMDRVDVVPASSPEAEVVKTGAVLVEGGRGRLPRTSPDQDPRAAADAVDGRLVPDERLHPEEMTEPLPEGEGAIDVVHRELDVRDAVHLDAHGSVLPGRAVESTGGGNGLHLGLSSLV